ncbi:MAG: hypothetical protein JW808_11490, partial [Victivallales bacterium]|nr:hypothetical protein [Victivallales bacterium]
MIEPVSKLRVNRVGSAGAADGAAKWLVHTRSCLCLPFRRGTCRTSVPTLWAASYVLRECHAGSIGTDHTGMPAPASAWPS